MSRSAEGPLAGVRVLDLSSVGPGARATRLLADYGASVVKVGPPPSTAASTTTPPFYAYAAGRSMRRVSLDLRDPDGREAFLVLASTADVVVESFRPGTVKRLGIGYEDVRARNPRVVYCSTSGYGQAGARAGWAGHDLDYLAVGGYLAMSSPAGDGAPPLPGATVADAAAGGMQAALSVLCALFDREHTGVGAFLDVSVANGVVWLMSLLVDEQLAVSSSPAPGHDVLSGRYACYGTYRARDGRWLAVAAIETKFFANLCGELGCEEWIERQYEDAAQPELRAVLESAFASDDRDRWVERLGASDTCVAPVQSIAEVAADEHFGTAGVVVEAKSDAHGSFRQLGPLLAGMPAVCEPVEVPDERGTDTEELLAEAGYDPVKLRELLAKGVVA